MSNSSDSDEDVHTAMSEEACARMAGYIYVSDNIRSEAVIRSQGLSIKKRYILVDGYPPQCDCVLINGMKCNTENCPNFNSQIACGPSCGPNCANQPWENRLFAAGAKTRLRQTGDKGMGLFATDLIAKDSWVGEYTGKVTRDPENSTAMQQAYYFDLRPEGHVIEAYEQGSCVRCVNHSCDPNCVADEWVHGNRITIIFRAGRDIHVGDELGLDYCYKVASREAAQICHCGAENCKGIIGTILNERRNKSKTAKSWETKGLMIKTARLSISSASNNPETTDDQDPAINALVTRFSADVSVLVTTPPAPQARPEQYVETHNFVACEPAYALVQYNGVLGIVEGRITECYVNEADIVIYVLSTRFPTSMEYHVPMFLIFHYHEDAAFVLQYEITHEERQAVQLFSTPYASRQNARNLQNNIAVTYASRFINGQLPTRRMERSKTPGLVAIGLPQYTLVAVEETNEDEPECPQETFNLSNVQFARRIITRSQVAAALAEANSQVPISAAEMDMLIQRRLMACSEPQPSTSRAARNEPLPSTSRAVRNEPLPSTSRAAQIELQRNNASTSCPAPAILIVQPGSNYDSTFRRPFQSTVDLARSDVLMERLLSYTVETVSTLALSRFPENHQISIRSIRSAVLPVLTYYYFDAPLQQRRFLTVQHFHFANEANQPSSTNQHTCSFCIKKHDSSLALRNHINTFHLIYYRGKCVSCGLSFQLPTLFRSHLADCNPDLALQLLLNICPQIMDAFADFAASMTSNNQQQLIYVPGLPVLNARNHELNIDQTFQHTLRDWPSNTQQRTARESPCEEANIVENNPVEQPAQHSERPHSDIRTRSTSRIRPREESENETSDNIEPCNDEQSNEPAYRTRGGHVSAPKPKKQKRRDVREVDEPVAGPSHRSRSKKVDKKKPKPRCAKSKPVEEETDETEVEETRRVTRAGRFDSRRHLFDEPYEISSGSDDDDMDHAEWKPPKRR